ncbi:MAG: RNA 2'-phosphotransferase [Opitutaceae bacterium]
MNASTITKRSKFLSLVLRHEPERIGLELDAQGWVSVAVLLRQMAEHGRPLPLEVLKAIVSSNDKKRFAFSEDERLIRANQGHSINVDLALEPVVPPMFLYHGTATRFEAQIRAEGLKRQQRQHVHLSHEQETAVRVGQRHGKPVILKVKASEMADAGALFYRSENGVWLTEQVPVDYLVFGE